MERHFAEVRASKVDGIVVAKVSRKRRREMDDGF
jgi:hypothetical protein